MEQIEHEICANCKKEIPQFNYVMHTAHCARNIKLCNKCNEAIPKVEFEKHEKICNIVPTKKVVPPKTNIESSYYYSKIKENEDKLSQQRKDKKLEKLDKLYDKGYRLNATTNITPTINNNQSDTLKKKSKLLPCKYCELELPKSDLDDHENYCGTRTDKCLECNELVMFKYKQLHMDTNHGFLKLKDEPGPKPSWDSSSSRTPASFHTDNYNNEFPSLSSASGAIKKNKKGESYKEISRRLDCKTEYIKNLLHDSASITVPLRHNGITPRNHFNHNKGPAPQPPTIKKTLRHHNPPTELLIPCEFCDTPIPHEDLILHETGCRPDLINYKNKSKNRSLSPLTPPLSSASSSPPSPPSSSSSIKNRKQESSKQYNDGDNDSDNDHYNDSNNKLIAQPNTPDVELPCEFCSDLFPASKLLHHQAECN